MTMHDDQVDIAAATVRALVDQQFPEWRDKEIRRLDSSGTVNVIFRIGDDLSARFPLRLADSEATRRHLEREARASAALAKVSPFPAPVPVTLGAPGPGYPMPWSVQTWLPGVPATDADPSASVNFALDLAALISALRTADTEGRQFAGDGRGGALTDHDEWMEECFEKSEGLLDVPTLRDLWSGLRALPRVGEDVMNHGDLIPGNVLVSGGRLSGVLDTGNFAPADPALDLVSAWHMLELEPREVLRRELACDELEWQRGKAWAFAQAMGLVWYYIENNPAMSAMGGVHWDAFRNRRCEPWAHRPSFQRRVLLVISSLRGIHPDQVGGSGCKVLIPALCVNGSDQGGELVAFCRLSGPASQARSTYSVGLPPCEPGCPPAAPTGINGRPYTAHCPLQGRRTYSDSSPSSPTNS